MLADNLWAVDNGEHDVVVRVVGFGVKQRCRKGDECKHSFPIPFISLTLTLPDMHLVCRAVATQVQKEAARYEHTIFVDVESFCFGGG